MTLGGHCFWLTFLLWPTCNATPATAVGVAAEHRPRPFVRAVNHFGFEYSSDNVSFTSVAPTIIDAGGDWHKFVYSVSVPTGANYVRISFPVSGNYWTGYS